MSMKKTAIDEKKIALFNFCHGRLVFSILLSFFILWTHQENKNSHSYIYYKVSLEKLACLYFVNNA